MSTVTTHDLFELINKGVFDGCLAIVTKVPPGRPLINRLREKALKHYQVVGIRKLGDVELEAGSVERPGLLILHGLERYGPDSPEIHSIRATLNAQRASGPPSVICLDSDSFEKHFNDRKSPFFRFCTAIEHGRIGDLDV